MKSLLIIITVGQLLLIDIAYCALNNVRFTSFDGYFRDQERQELELELKNLETNTLHYQFYSIDIPATNNEWLQRFYNISRIAVSLLKNFEPKLTPVLAVEIARSNRWFPTIKLDEKLIHNDWHLHFDWHPPPTDPEKEESVSTRDWRKLTNRILLWKTRQDNWEVLLSYKNMNAVKKFSIPIAVDRMFDDLYKFYKNKFDELITKSWSIHIDHEWIEAVCNASFISKELLEKKEDILLLKDALPYIRPLGWSVSIDLQSDAANILKYEIKPKPSVFYLGFTELWPSELEKKAEDILYDWTTLTNHIISWKKRLTNKSFNI